MSTVNTNGTREIVYRPNYLKNHKKFPSGSLIFPTCGADFLLTDLVPKTLGGEHIFDILLCDVALYSIPIVHSYSHYTSHSNPCLLYPTELQGTSGSVTTPDSSLYQKWIVGYALLQNDGQSQYNTSIIILANTMKKMFV